MSLLTPDQWEVRTNHAPLMVVALFVRDRAGLMPRIEPFIPRLTPNISPTEGVRADSDRVVLEQAWTAWWHDLLNQAQAGGHLVVPREAGALRAAVGNPELADLVSTLLPPALHWLSEQSAVNSRELAEKRSHLPVEAKPFMRATSGHPFRKAKQILLRVTELPVAGTFRWHKAIDHIVVGKQFRASQEYQPWINTVVGSLVAHSASN